MVSNTAWALPIRMDVPTSKNPGHISASISVPDYAN